LPNEQSQVEKQTKSDTRNIVRIWQPDNDTYGWQVRWRRNGDSHSRFFSDSVHGGANEALIAAQTYRNRHLPAPSAHIKQNCYRVEHRVRNGRGELSICVWAPKKLEDRRYFYRVYVSRDYLLTKARFNQALSKALTWRRKQEEAHQEHINQQHLDIIGE